MSSGFMYVLALEYGLYIIRYAIYIYYGIRLRSVIHLYSVPCRICGRMRIKDV